MKAEKDKPGTAKVKSEDKKNAAKTPVKSESKKDIKRESKASQKFKSDKIVDIMKPQSRSSRTKSAGEISIKIKVEKEDGDVQEEKKEMRRKSKQKLMRKKPVINYPVVKTKPWRPKSIEKKPKVIIDYPPVTLRTK